MHTSMDMEREKHKFKILMFPWLAHGHITPFLELSKRLSRTNYFTIYLCSSTVNLDSIKSSLSDEDDASVQLVELHMPSSPQLPPQLHTTKNLPSDLLPALMQAFQESSSSFTDIMDSVKPDLLIYDFFQPWAPKIASSKAKGIPSVLFSTSGATTASYFHHFHTVGSGATFPYPAINLPNDEMGKVLARIVPNLKDADDDFAFGAFTRSSDIVLLKTCREFEGKYLDYLSVLCKKQIVCTGPLIADGDDFESSGIMKWLNGKHHGSTLYISFGSECFLSKKQIGEIAKGLLQLCDVNFLWVIRFPLEEREREIEKQVPEGFFEKVEERGMVVPSWVPQKKILGHPSIGGFVSHCGWSSVIESIYYGVPVIGMPMKADQPLNAKFVVELGVGVEVEKDDAKGLYVGEDVGKAMNKVMVEKTVHEGFWSKARRLSETIRDKEETQVNEVAEQLLKICMKNKKYM